MARIWTLHSSLLINQKKNKRVYKKKHTCGPKSAIESKSREMEIKCRYRRSKHKKVITNLAKMWFKVLRVFGSEILIMINNLRKMGNATPLIKNPQFLTYSLIIFFRNLLFFIDTLFSAAESIIYMTTLFDRYLKHIYLLNLIN